MRILKFFSWKSADLLHLCCFLGPVQNRQKNQWRRSANSRRRENLRILKFFSRKSADLLHLCCSLGPVQNRQKENGNFRIKKTTPSVEKKTHRDKRKKTIPRTPFRIIKTEKKSGKKKAPILVCIVKGEWGKPSFF